METKNFRLIQTPHGAYFLNAPTGFSESLKGRQQQSSSFPNFSSFRSN